MIDWRMILQTDLQAQGVPALPEDGDVLGIWRWMVTAALAAVMYLYIKDQIRRKWEDKRKEQLEIELKGLNEGILNEAKTHSKELLSINLKVVQVVENNTDTMEKNICTVEELTKETKTLRELVLSNIREATQGKRGEIRK